MWHRKGFRKLNRDPQHRKMLLKNLAKELIDHGKVDTTVARAKEGARLAERLITLAKRNTPHARRQAFAILQDPKLTDKLFAELGPKYMGRTGGYTRVLKLPPRPGDGAELARLTWV
ncbi:MAG: 50S ribosomal protein L17 [Candidatus Bipolaricaulota bacterium]|nr:50S ribosomal protein L17 [Candidatus Bipolaricaulota bacterium]MCS7275046.1 50S ribosomal protein L17 [Candidatus Bipolaricaulota bacterium]MDW8110374.1 50S ribosomal protein L17 [Candidatus Bipolaricaulota bacterium]MDW8329555.1 50S ribosomal protein L17 [Candidatus Bipolaricaulota bacterium]